MSIAQTKELDSLKLILENPNLQDTTKVNIYNNIASRNLSIDLEKTKTYALKAYEVTKKKTFIRGEARSLYLLSIQAYEAKKLDRAKNKIKASIELYSKINDSKALIANYQLLAAIYNKKKNIEKTIFFYNKAYTLAKENNDKTQEALIQTILGELFAHTNHNKSILYFTNAIKTYRSINEEIEITRALNNLSNVYSEQGRFLEAIECLQQCLETNERLNKKNESAINYVNIGLLYSDLKQTQKAISYIEKAIVFYKKNNKNHELSLCYLNIGNIHEQDKKFTIAEEYYNKGIYTAKGINNNTILYYCHSNIAHLNYQLKKYDTSLENYKKSLKIVDALKNNYFKCELYLEVAKLYLARKEHSNAFNYTLKANKIAYNLNLVEKQKESHDILSKLYKVKGDFKKAYENHKQFKILSDSLFNKETIEKISKIEAEYKYKQEIESGNKRELKLTQKVNITSENLKSFQKNYFIGIIIFLITSLILLTSIFFLKIRNISAKNANIITEQKLLRSQMTPHFIFNSLAVLQGIILNKEERKSVSYLTKFSKLLRLILENSREDIVPLADELKAIESYIALQNIHNTSTDYEYEVKIDSNVNQHKFSIPPMLIQPFIENAIEHAFINQKEKKQIIISLHFKNNDLICIIKDNGIGLETYKKENTNHKKSLATTITRERLEILASKYKTKGSLLINNNNNNERGTIVTLTIPYKIIKND